MILEKSIVLKFVEVNDLEKYTLCKNSNHLSSLSAFENFCLLTISLLLLSANQLCSNKVILKFIHIYKIQYIEMKLYKYLGVNRLDPKALFSVSNTFPPLFQ
jgi:hypothetical protein